MSLFRSLWKTYEKQLLIGVVLALLFFASIDFWNWNTSSIHFLGFPFWLWYDFILTLLLSVVFFMIIQFTWRNK